MVFLAGGIGMQLLEGEKLSFKDFLTSAQKFGIGDQDIVGSDLWHVCTIAEYYSKYKDFKRIWKYQEDLEPYAIPNDEKLLEDINILIEECYEEAYAILQANKDKLDVIVRGTLDKGVSSGDEIYTLVGAQRPKYYFELTPFQTMQRDFTCWLAWTYKRMSFYERNHPQI